MKTSRDDTPARMGRPRVYASDAERKAAYRRREQERRAATKAEMEALLKATRRLCYARDLPAEGVPEVIASLNRLADEAEETARQTGRE